MRFPDDIYVVHQTLDDTKSQSIAFLDLIDAYAHVKSLKAANGIRLFYEMQEELTKTGSASLCPGITITRHPLSKPRTLISCGA
jgi:hypothetical protein